METIIGRCEKGKRFIRPRTQKVLRYWVVDLVGLKARRKERCSHTNVDTTIISLSNRKH